jgi:hypothetical protein
MVSLLAIWRVLPRASSIGHAVFLPGQRLDRIPTAHPSARADQDHSLSRPP